MREVELLESCYVLGGNARYFTYTISFNFQSQDLPKFRFPSCLSARWPVIWNYITPLLKTVRFFLTSPHSMPSFPHCTGVTLTAFHSSSHQHCSFLNTAILAAPWAWSTQCPIFTQPVLPYYSGLSSNITTTTRPSLTTLSKRGTSHPLSVSLPAFWFSGPFTTGNDLVWFSVWFLPLRCKFHEKDLVLSSPYTPCA